MLMVATMLSACERIGRARQCQRLAETVNEAMAEIGGEEQQLNQAGLLRAAAQYESLAQRLGPMEFSERELALEVASLNRLLSEASVTTKNLASAVADDERAQASLYKRELRTLGTQMKLQGNRIDRTCRGP